MSKPSRLNLVLVCAACCLGIPAASWAGIFSVMPVRIYMGAKDRAVAVTLINESDSPVVLQADLYRWQQKVDGSDELTSTEDLILSPPIIALGPKARQVVRLARLLPGRTDQQLTYRMIVREVPEALSSGTPSMEVPIAIALSMPVFITPESAARAVDCEVERDGERLHAACRNRGNAYAQIRELRLHQADTLIARFDGGPYILPGARKSMALERVQPGQAGEARLSVVFDDFQSASFAVQLR